jgi:hypothetical protein
LNVNNLGRIFLLHLAATWKDLVGAKAEYLKQLDGNLFNIKSGILIGVSDKCFNRFCSSQARFDKHKSRLRKTVGR